MQFGLSLLVPQAAGAVSLAPPAQALSLSTSGKSATPTLSWVNIHEAASYNYQYAQDIAFADAPLLNTSTTQVVLSSLAMGTYYWRVQTVSPTGEPGEWSAPQKFTVNDSLTSTSAIKNNDTIGGTITDDTGLSSYSVKLLDADGAEVGSSAAQPLSGKAAAVSYAWPNTLPNGNYVVEFTVTNLAGVSHPYHYSVTLSNDLPASTATLSSTSQMAVDGAVLTVQGVASPNTSGIELKNSSTGQVIPVALGAGGTWLYSLGSLVAGTYEFIVTSFDSMGNISSQTISTQIRPYVAPIHEVISPDMITPLSRPGAFLPLTTIATVADSLPLTSTIDSSSSTTTVTPTAPSIDNVAMQNKSSQASNPPGSSAPVVAATPSGWRAFGVGWQWWLLGVGACLVGWWLVKAYRFSLSDADDM